MANIKGLPFVYKGVANVEDCRTSEEVMKKAHLDWEVAKANLYCKMPASEDIDLYPGDFIYGADQYGVAENHFGIFRKDCNLVLGVVKDKYVPVQNIEAFKFFDNAIGKNKAIWQTAGCFGKGEKVFVSAKLPNTIVVNGEDPVDNYLVFMTSHDGSTGVKMLLSPIRIVCQNTLNAAIANATNMVSFRHTESIHDNLGVAAELLGVCEKKTQELQEIYTELARKEVNDFTVQKAFAELILSKKEIDAYTSVGFTHENIFRRDWRAIEAADISTKKLNTLCAMEDYYFTGIGQPNWVGTAWGAYNAVTGYFSNVDNTDGQKRMDTLLYGDRSRKIEMIGNLLLAA
jgi:phage/plasmid-like protein (TIGR03299 family)